jgi:hypothetical protein
LLPMLVRGQIFWRTVLRRRCSVVGSSPISQVVDHFNLQQDCYPSASTRDSSNLGIYVVG